MVNRLLGYSFVNRMFFQCFMACVWLLWGLIFIVGCEKAEQSIEISSPFTFVAALSDGRRQFHVRKCAECHGPQGLGGTTGTESAVLKDFERPLSLKEIQNIATWNDVLKVADILRYGLPDTLLSYRHAYPFLSDEEILNISLYTLYLRMPETLTSQRNSPFSPIELDVLRHQLKKKRKIHPPRP